MRRSYLDIYLSRNFGWYFSAGRHSVVFWRGRHRRFAIDRSHSGQVRFAVGRQRVTFSNRRLVRTFRKRNVDGVPRERRRQT